MVCAGQLNSLGVIKFFADVVGGKLVAMNMGWPAVFGLLNVAYFFLHYMFASQTAHVGALYSAFLAMMLSAGAPPHAACQLGVQRSKVVLLSSMLCCPPAGTDMVLLCIDSCSRQGPSSPSCLIKLCQCICSDAFAYDGSASYV